MASAASPCFAASAPASSISASFGRCQRPLLVPLPSPSFSSYTSDLRQSFNPLLSTRRSSPSSFSYAYDYGGTDGLLYGDDGGGSGVQDQARALLELKQGLLDTLQSTQRGWTANGEAKSEIMELISVLESKNPTPAPMQAVNLLHGKWVLVYTSLSEFFPVLAAGSLPLIRIGEISDSIDTSDFTVMTSVTFVGPLATASFTANASLEICSQNRVQVKVEEAIIGTPQVTDSLRVPQSINIFGQNFDLIAFQGLFQTLQSATYAIGRSISGQPSLRFPIKSESAQAWLLATYLDQDLRISRSDNGTVFVFVKHDSPLLGDVNGQH